MSCSSAELIVLKASVQSAAIQVYDSRAADNNLKLPSGALTQKNMLQIQKKKEKVFLDSTASLYNGDELMR